MNKSIELLKNYTKAGHNQLLFEHINPIEFSINAIKSENWNNVNWLQNNDVPYVAYSHLLDSYDCLPNRPDMAFTFLWKSINNTYKNISIKERLANNDQSRLSDSNSIDIFLIEIDRIKTRTLTTGISILDLINKYIQYIPDKPLKFISNVILKGNAIENISTINKVLNTSSFNSFKSNHSTIFQFLSTSYCVSYNAISHPVVTGNHVDFQISNVDKSKSIQIQHSLAMKLRELLLNKTTSVTESATTTSHVITFADDKEFLTFIFKTILYSIRNNSVHGNLVSRLNSEFADDDSLKTAIYIYFLGHLFLSIGLYINNDLTIDDLSVSIDNLELLKTLI